MTFTLDEKAMRTMILPATRRCRSHSVWFALLGMIMLGGASACSDSSGPELPTFRQVGVVLNSVDVSLTVFGVDSSEPPITIGLAPDGSPVSMAVRGSVVAVPLGFVPAVAIVDLETAAVTRTIALPEGSGATGAAFLDDERLLVANPGLSSVSLVNVADGTVADPIPVGAFPQSLIVQGGRVFVLNGELGPDFLPAGPGTITVLNAANLEVVATVILFTGFHFAYGYSAEESGWAKRLILGPRYFIPLLPLLALCAADVWPRFAGRIAARASQDRLPLLERPGTSGRTNPQS